VTVGAPSGERNGRVKLTDAQCAELVADRERGANYRTLMARYGLSKFGVWRVINVRGPRVRGTPPPPHRPRGGAAPIPTADPAVTAALRAWR
jgi:hypothetical protein